MHHALGLTALYPANQRAMSFLKAKSVNSSNKTMTVKKKKKKK